MEDSVLEKLIQEVNQLSKQQYQLNLGAHEKIFDELVEIKMNQQSSDSKFSLILHRLTKVENNVQELSTILRGDNDKGGIITEIAVMKQIFERTATSKGKTQRGEDAGSKYITWFWVVEKLLQPVVIAIVLWLLFNVIPKVGGGY